MAKKSFDPSPWGLAGTTEHSHQRAIFAWANCAALYGFNIANDPCAYRKETRDPAYHPTAYAPVPELQWLYAVHNQGHGDKIRGAMAKAEGVKTGVSDMCLPVTRHGGVHGAIRYAGLYLELKRPELQPKRGGDGGVSPVQLDFMNFVIGQGYHAAVAYGWEDAVSLIQRYMTTW